VGLRPQRQVALETLGLCADFREHILQSVQPVVWVSIAAAICTGRSGSRKKLNPMADLGDAEYRRRYELGRRRYYAERAERRTLRKAWISDHGPWLLLAVIAVLLAAVLGLAQPNRFIVITTLALYGGLAWVVCWAVRASC
jgi:hypothetical protein